jgi:MFS family permease
VVHSLYRRELRTYPRTPQRYANLGVVVLATVLLYYELYVTGAVAPEIIADYHMSFPYFVGILVVGNAIGAFTSLLAGLADRYGRANLVVIGLLLTGLLTAFGIPACDTKLQFGVVYALIGFVEGIILVATPALVRDFSPQVGRASAMGFWTLGPVVGSLVVSTVTTSTFTPGDDWREQFQICGAVGLVVWLVALLVLRELHPSLREQVVVTLEDVALASAHPEGVTPAVDRSWRPVLRLPVISAALAIALYLLLYYTAVAFFVIYLQTVHDFPTNTANNIMDFYWGANAVALIVTGFLSDRLGVRKPFMVLGGLLTVAASLLLIHDTSNAPTDKGALQLLMVLFGVGGGLAFAPWMAAFTEDIERRNPALTATGLAVWGWILRAVVALSFLLLPQVITSVTPVVQYGQQALAIQAARPQLVAKVQANRELVARLASYPSPEQIPPAVLAEALDRLGPVTLLELQKPEVRADLLFLQAHGAQVLAAKHRSPKEWNRWFSIALGGQLVFLPLAAAMSGPWSPRRARAARAEHERRTHALLTGAT